MKESANLLKMIEGVLPGEKEYPDPTTRELGFNEAIKEVHEVLSKIKVDEGKVKNVLIKSFAKYHRISTTVAKIRIDTSRLKLDTKAICQSNLLGGGK